MHGCKTITILNLTIKSPKKSHINITYKFLRPGTEGRNLGDRNLEDKSLEDRGYKRSNVKKIETKKVEIFSGLSEIESKGTFFALK